MDYNEIVARTFNSELGQELNRLRSDNENLDPSSIKEILVTAEDLRISKRLSELSYGIFDQRRITESSSQIKKLRLDFRNGQQCVRDFFICLNQNLVNWPDVYSNLSFQLIHSTECLACKCRIESETT